MTPTEAANQIFGLGRKLTQSEANLAAVVAHVRSTGRKSQCWRCDRTIWHHADHPHDARRWIDHEGWSWCGGTRPAPEPDPHEPKTTT